MNVSRLKRLTGIQRFQSLSLITALFSSQSGSPFIVSWVIGSSKVTEHVSDDQRHNFLDDTVFVAKLSTVCEAKKNCAPCYFCNNFVESCYIGIIIGIYIPMGTRRHGQGGTYRTYPLKML